MENVELQDGNDDYVDMTDDEIEFVNDKPSTSSKARVEVTDNDFSMNEAVPSTSGTQRPKRKVSGIFSLFLISMENITILSPSLVCGK